MATKLDSLIENMSDIAGFSFALVDEEGQILSGSLKKNFVINESVLKLKEGEVLADKKKKMSVMLVSNDSVNGLYLIADTEKSEDLRVVKMAGLEIKLYLENETKGKDKNSFASSIVSDDINEADVYRLANRLRIKDVNRVAFVFELAGVVDDASALSLLSMAFSDGKQDFFFKKDDRHLVLIKAYEKGVGEAEIKEFALSALDTLVSELMVKMKVGISTEKATLMELKEAYKEAMMALKVTSIFKQMDEVCLYSRLGIARLIYELPVNLCEMFLHEVFGENIPTDDLDEETRTIISKFFENNLNISETARQLYLHRNTLVYKLERFEKVSGLDLRKFDDAMTYQIATMVLAHYRESKK